MKRLGLWSGVGINIGAMIGVGVFISAGFMADSMGPGMILVAWLAGGLLAMAGARAYAELATLIPRSGGEYRFLSELFHPWLGSLAGWTSLVAGFSAPVATNAKILVPFAGTLFPGVDVSQVGAAVIVAVTLAHAFDLAVSHRAQNALALTKVILVAAFIAVGLVFGAHQLPDWRPSVALAPGGFMAQFVYVVYAYIGWSSAAYAAEEFDDPRRTVPRSMVLSAALVMGIYLLVNAIFVANLAPATVAEFLHSDTSRVTLGHLIVARLVGAGGGQVMSVLVLVALVSAISALTFVGPRVYQAMARDGFLPRLFAGRADGRPPLFSVLLQGALALLLYYTHAIADLVADVAVVLTATSGLTVATLWKLRFGEPGRRPGPLPLVCATLFMAVSAWLMIAQTAHTRGGTLALWVGSLCALTTVGYALARRRGVA